MPALAGTPCRSPYLARPITGLAAAPAGASPSNAVHQSDRQLDGCALPEKVEENLHPPAPGAGPLHDRDQPREQAAPDLHPVPRPEGRERPDDAALARARRDERDHAVMHRGGSRAEGDEAAHAGRPDHVVVLLEERDVNEEVAREEGCYLVTRPLEDAGQENPNPAPLELLHRVVFLARLAAGHVPVAILNARIRKRRESGHEASGRLQFQCHESAPCAAEVPDFSALLYCKAPLESALLSHPCSPRSGALLAPPAPSGRGMSERRACAAAASCSRTRSMPAGLAAPHGIRQRMRGAGRRRAGRSAAARQRFRPLGLAAQPVLLAAQRVELHLAVQRRRVDQGVLGGEVDAAAILAEYARQVVLLRPPQVLLERHLVVVVAVAAVAVRGLLADPAVAGQVDLADDGPARTQDGALDHVAELAHVARPRVAHELREGLVGDAVDALLARHLAVAQELADQKRDVLDALAQRRDAYRHHVDTVVEVLAHPALGHRLRQLHVGGRDDPHVDLDAAVGAELLDLALLEHAQELQLHVERDALDLVEEERAAGGELDLAHPVVDRPREGAALVAEELALEERVREGRAVDGDEAAALALALEVDGARGELLARARLAVDEDGRVVLRQHADGLEDLVHDAVAAHHVGEAVAVRELAAEVADLVEQP